MAMIKKSWGWTSWVAQWLKTLNFKWESSMGHGFHPWSGLRSHVPPGGAIKENLWGTRGLLLLGQRPVYVETTQP